MDIVSNSSEKMKNDSVKRKFEEEEEEEENLNFEIQTDNLTARFELEKQLNFSEKEEKNDIEENEFLCYVCGLRGNKFLDHSFGCNHQDAHRYCALKERYCALKKLKYESLEAKDEAMVRSYCALKELKDKRLEVNDEDMVWRVEVEDRGRSPYKFFKELNQTRTSLIERLQWKKLKD